MSMTLRQLEALRLVLSRGTTKHAAEALGLTQSAVSRLISQLEQEVGFPLFERRQGRLRVTPEGQQFYTTVEKVLTGVDQIKAMARDISTLSYASLRIAAMAALGFGMLPPAIQSIRKRYRRLRVSVDIGTRSELEDGVMRGRYDLGLVTLPIENDALVVEPLGGIESVCVLPLDHPLADRDIIRPQDLEGEQFISMEPGTLFRYRTDELFSRLGIRRTLQIETQSTIMICGFVAQGLGVSLVHRFIGETFADRLIVKTFEPTFGFEFGLILPSGSPLPLIAQEFIDTIKEGMRDFQRRGQVSDLPADFALSASVKSTP